MVSSKKKTMYVFIETFGLIYIKGILIKSSFFILRKNSMFVWRQNKVLFFYSRASEFYTVPVPYRTLAFFVYRSDR